ncbi:MULTISPECIES: hypothetical protein [unclassified Actinopolyspora]|uniref:hypothetical protein n=1 Tax=unclassified Actinopolyspora TaxID=2639451 RepID=UPI0013F699AB|nr:MULTISPECIES: hypothetical protein [unclassified Actinopolyspora]NHD17800.1 hypothetical protein [Actinopolyspora sp. BKK2]NHE77673.1 hypothetical protein [Actinopolyspora sp. BKK1]
MTDIDEVYGHVHTGSGDQFIEPKVVMNFLRETTEYMRESGVISRNDLGWLKRLFVPPQGFGLARERLSDTWTVLLHGPVGSGRRSAAKMLLHELSDETSSFAEFTEEALSAEAKLFPDKVGYGQRLLLDLTRSDPDTLSARRRELPALRAALDEQKARLVVVLPYDGKDWADEELARQFVEIARPSGHVVLRRHLEEAGIALPEEEELGPELLQYLTGPLRDIAKLASLVVRVEKDHPDWWVSEWLHAALAAVTERREEAAEQVARHSEARERAVLFAAAMCYEASADAIFFVAQNLMELLELTGREAPRLEQRGHRSQLEDLEVRPEQHGERVGFASFAYDRALRSHFWENYPDLRPWFCKCSENAVFSAWLSRRDRRNLVDRYLEHGLDTGCVEGVIQTINRWSDTERNSSPAYWMQFADQALVIGLNDQRYGTRFRRLVYDWSCDENLTAPVGQLLVHVCTEVIAPEFPEQAIVRLHQRARRETDPAEPTARQALRGMALADRGMLRRMIHRFATEFREPRWWKVDLDLFVEMLDPGCLLDDGGATKPLAAESVVRSELVLSWRTMMDNRPDLTWSTVRWWLEAAGRSPSRDLLLWILVEAAGHEIEVLGKLHVTARDWSQVSGGDPGVAARLTQLIDSYQGIDDVDYTVASSAEEASP